MINISALYLLEQGTKVRKKGERVIVEIEGETKQDLPVFKISQVIVCGRVSITPAAVEMFLKRELEVVYLTAYGQFLGRLQSTSPKNCLLQVAQFKSSFDDNASTYLAGRFIFGNLKNMLNILQRANRKNKDIPEKNITIIKNAIKKL